MKTTKSGLPIVNQSQLSAILRAKKPILVLGKPGVGKTHTMKDELKGIVSSHELMTIYSEGGMEALRGKLNTYLTHYSYLFIDDIGTEQEASHYGSKLDTIQWLVYTCYEKQIPLFLTSNLNLDEIETKYGLRVVERLKEMCYVVVLEGVNHRTDKLNQDIQVFLDEAKA